MERSAFAVLNAVTAAALVGAWVLLSGQEPMRAAGIALMCLSMFLFGLNVGRELAR